MSFKPYCERSSRDNAKLYLSQNDWDKINEFVIYLPPCKKFTIKLQAPNMTLTDTYKI